LPKTFKQVAAAFWVVVVVLPAAALQWIAAVVEIAAVCFPACMLVRPLAAVPLRLPIALQPLPQLIPAAVAVADQVSWLASMPARLLAAVRQPPQIVPQHQLLLLPAAVRVVAQVSWLVFALRRNPPPAAVQPRLPPAEPQPPIAAVVHPPLIAVDAAPSARTAVDVAMPLPTAAVAVRSVRIAADAVAPQP
jgi:hypothetical protein